MSYQYFINSCTIALIQEAQTKILCNADSVLFESFCHLIHLCHANLQLHFTVFMHSHFSLFQDKTKGKQF